MRSRAALADYNGSGDLAALLWFQGVTRENAELYQGPMEALVRDVRSELGRPDLLIIQVWGFTSCIIYLYASS